MLTPLVRLSRLGIASGLATAGERMVAEETAIALSYDGATHAVMMASPADLEDFAIGFSLAEGVIAVPNDIVDLEMVDRGALGCELRMRLSPDHALGHARRRRRLAGPMGCGLCGIESLAEAARPAPQVTSDLLMSPGVIAEAMMALAAAQRLNREARAIHAAAFWQPRNGLMAIREDVGRHNALDKLGGALARRGLTCADGAVLLTSRVSVEMVQKAARLGAPMLLAVSAPTALAVRTAAACGVTLVAVARGEHCEIFTHAGRVTEANGWLGNALDQTPDDIAPLRRMAIQNG